jgi:flagellar biosynthesis protein FlhF
MKARKIVAPDMRQALKMVRDQMGAEAVILSNRKVAHGVEVTATLDYDAVVAEHREKQRQKQHIPPWVDSQAQMPAAAADPAHLMRSDLQSLRQEADRRHAQRVAAQQIRQERVQQGKAFSQSLLEQVKPMPSRSAPSASMLDGLSEDRVELSAKRPSAEAVPPTPGRGLDQDDYGRVAESEWAGTSVPVEPQAMMAMQAELAELRALLQQQWGAVGWGDYSYRHPLAAAIFRRLTQLGLGPALCRELVQALPEQQPKKEAWRQVLTGLAAQLPVQNNKLFERGGVVALLGPAGVGKTTTIAKLAAQYALQQGSEGLALVTTDHFRLAGHEQLKALARILKVPLRVVGENQSLDTVLRGLSRKKLVLIDTAGLGAQEPHFSGQCSLIDAAVTPIEKWLVLSATSQQRLLQRAIAQYGDLKLSGCVLTKLDEAVSLGESFTAIIEHRLPLAYITNGQTIPDDLQVADARSLVDRAVALSRDWPVDDGVMADVFSRAQASRNQPQRLSA